MNGTAANSKTACLIYSGCTETVGYDEAKITKGFYHVQVTEKGEVQPELIELAALGDLSF